MDLAEIDFAGLYRARAAARQPGRAAGYWDRRAAAMSERAFDGDYVRRFVAHVELEGCSTLLDVGCGPGTIGLSLADRLGHVYGLDYSPSMLEAFTANARARGLSNATAIRRAWEDDWSDVPACDLVVASRSTAVPDLEAAVLKLCAKARRRVYITYPADGGSLSGEACRAIGRADAALPDYLCVAGILHHLGIRPALDFLPGKSCLAGGKGFGDFLAKVTDRLGALTAAEEARLREYYGANRNRLEHEPVQWALFSWPVP